MSDLDWMASEVSELNIAKGWRDLKVTPVERIALIMTEVAEMVEAYRNYGMETVDVAREEFTVLKPVDVASEAADVLIRLLDFCECYGINLEEQFDRKMKFNWTRPERHGGKLL